MNAVNPNFNKSGIQREVLALYRMFIKSAKAKNDDAFCAFVKMEFKERARSVKKYDFKSIEHNIRYGQKQLKLIQSPGFISANYSSHNV